METSREDYQSKMEAQLKIWGAKLEVLQAEAEKAALNTKKELLDELSELKKIQTAGSQHLETIKVAADDTWDTLKTDLTDKWNQVSGAADAILSRIKKTIS